MNHSSVLSFQDMIRRLQNFWSDRGCAVLPAMDSEVGAGTFHPETTLRTLGPKPYRCAFLQPSRRPQDGRYGENPNRFYKHHQFQVVLKPSPNNAQDLALDSLQALGLTSRHHDLRFIEDNWESPTLGASGLGFEVWCDGMEILQFTYFQQMGGMALHPVSLELAYGLERIALQVQQKDNTYDLVWCDGPPQVTYRDLFLDNEREQSAYSFDRAHVPDLLHRFQVCLDQGHALLKPKEQNVACLPLVRPAYEHCLQASHAFNTLDARGALSPQERVTYIAGVRDLAKACFETYARLQGFA